MYESPIDLVYTDYFKSMNDQIENAVCEAVVKVGVIVDKEELIKALQYDRNQYEKGYADGVRRRKGYWIKGGYACSDTEWICSVCDAREWRTNKTQYCPRCGAEMEGDYDGRD